MTLPRVLLVEDDAAIRQWVAMALEDAGVELVACARVDAALDVLRRQPVQLLLTDLMLPGRSGHDLLAELAQSPALRAGACLVAFSAGLDAAAQERLHALGVWRCLSKPATLAQLLDCVDEGLAQARTPAAAHGAPTEPGAGSAPAQRPLGPAPLLPPQGSATDAACRALAVAQHFGGDAVLFDAFEASCHAALADDLRSGSAALDARDLQALRRLAHSLKSVLQMLGLPALAAAATSLERQALAADLAGSTAAWAALRDGLALWLQRRGAQSSTL